MKIFTFNDARPKSGKIDVKFKGQWTAVTFCDGTLENNYGESISIDKYLDLEWRYCEPQAIESPNFTKLTAACHELLEFIRDDYTPGDVDRFNAAIAVNAMEAVYGGDVYLWIGKKVGDNYGKL